MLLINRVSVSITGNYLVLIMLHSMLRFDASIEIVLLGFDRDLFACWIPSNNSFPIQRYIGAVDGCFKNEENRIPSAL